MHSLRSIRLTVRFLPGHTLAGIEHTSEVAHCSPQTVRDFLNLVGTQRNGVEFIRAEEF
mgnify:CR=1 FL=1|jgi:hypothetical protein